MVRRRSSNLKFVLPLLVVFPLVFAHPHDEPSQADMDMAIPKTSSTEMGVAAMSSIAAMSPATTPPVTYFTHPEYSGLMLAHIGLMIVAWFFLLPIAVMLSVARSRLALVIQIGFLAVNAVGLLVGTVYNSKTPDLYENNLHHKFGWAITWIVLAQVILGLLRWRDNGKDEDPASHEEQTAFISPNADNMSGYQQMRPGSVPAMHRYSHDSGHGTESNSSRSNSLAGLHEEKEEEKPARLSDRFETSVNLAGRPKNLGAATTDRFASYLARIIPRRAMGLINLFYDTVDVSILVLGFVAILTGAITYGGVFKGSNIFNGLAHSIKGGIFFWYGLLTLGRWMGCFADYGWAWNVRPPAGLVSARKAKIPSAEFVESLVIFLYGSTNVFLEHLAAWGDAWTAEDLEHVSISIMFFGGGLCGMLIESKKVRDLLNASLSRRNASQDENPTKEQWTPPTTYSFSLNPFPGLIILLLGLMMSSHHQHSMISTMVHKQWGTLFVGFALARAVTYILTYLSPPSSFLPSRPPSEIVASFCLISGGMIFIASNKNTVAAMERYDLNAMFIFTVTMGLTAFVMAWEIIVLAVKGWAVRRKLGGTNPGLGTLA